MNEEIKKSFLVYYDNEIIISRLSDEDAGKLFKSLFLYGRENKKPDFEYSPVLAMAFDILSIAVDRDKEKYFARCKKNRENGRKGGLAKASNLKQSLPIAKQGLANLADKDMDMDKDMDKDMERDKDMDMERDMDKDMERDKDMDMERDTIIDYQQIADMYNNTCVSFPRLTKLSEKRKKAIKARLKMYTIEDFKKLFEMAESSSFLKGQNSRNWSANFDWLTTDTNMAKVLDGNYVDKEKQEGSDSNAHGDSEQRPESANRRPAAAIYAQYLPEGHPLKAQLCGDGEKH